MFGERWVLELGTPENPMLHDFSDVVSNFKIAAYDIIMMLRRQQRELGQLYSSIFELGTLENPNVVCFLVYCIQFKNCCLWHHNDATPSAWNAGSI